MKISFSTLGCPEMDVPQIIEIARPCLLAAEISRSRFFRNAKAFSENYFEHEVVYHFDHAIIKPPMNQRETAWHQAPDRGPETPRPQFGATALLDGRSDGMATHFSDFMRR